MSAQVFSPFSRLFFSSFLCFLFHFNRQFYVCAFWKCTWSVRKWANHFNWTILKFIRFSTSLQREREKHFICFFLQLKSQIKKSSCGGASLSLNACQTNCETIQQTCQEQFVFLDMLVWLVGSLFFILFTIHNWLMLESRACVCESVMNMAKHWDACVQFTRLNSVWLVTFELPNFSSFPRFLQSLKLFEFIRFASHFLRRFKLQSGDV